MFLKGLFGSLTGSVASSVGNNLAQKAVNQGINKLASEANSKHQTYTFAKLPTSLEEFKALPEACLTDVYAVAALSVLALTRYETSKEECFEMLNFLKGPEPLSPTDKSQINDRFMDGKTYKVRALFEGATPENNYTPAQPYTIKVSSNPYSFQNPGWANLYVHSGGADSPRPLRLRQKPSTGQWFLVEIQYLGDIRIPAAEDKWR